VTDGIRIGRATNGCLDANQPTKFTWKEPHAQKREKQTAEKNTRWWRGASACKLDAFAIRHGESFIKECNR